MVITHAAIIGTVTELAGLHVLLSAGIVFFRVVTGNGYIRAPVRATFVSQTGLCFVIPRNEIEDRANLRESGRTPGSIPLVLRTDPSAQ